MPKIKGTALFFLRDAMRIPPYIVKTMFTNDIIYEDNILVCMARIDLPFGVAGRFRQELARGLRIYEINAGYMELISLEKLMKKAGINEKTIFYGLEDIATRNLVWKIFSLIKRITPTFNQFHKLPTPKLHGVVTRVEL
jgi:KUP system potassium uptake protein